MSRFESRFAVLVFVALVFSSLACSINFGGGTETPTQTPGSAVQTPGSVVQFPSPTPAQQATQPPAQTIPTLAAALPQFGAVNSNLDKLDSYRIVFSMGFKGKDKDGKDVDQTVTILQEKIKSKNSSHMKMSGMDLGSDGFLEMFQVDKTAWMYIKSKDQPKATCLSYSSDKPAVQENDLITPDEVVKDLTAESLVAKGETVNGIKADHYKLKKPNFGMSNVTSSSGDIWVAQDGGYVVRLNGKADGTFDITGKQIIGTMTYNYDLSDVNKLTGITLPAECKTQAESSSDLPIYPTATDKFNMGDDMISYKTPDSVDVVAAWLRKELPNRGWKITQDSNMGGVAMLAIEKSGKKLQVMVTPGQGNKGSQVIFSKAQ